MAENWLPRGFNELLDSARIILSSFTTLFGFCVASVFDLQEASCIKAQRCTLGEAVGTRLEDFIIFEGRSALSR